MRVISILLFLFAFSGVARADSDHIIFRTGQEADVKLFQINDQRIVYALDKRPNSERFESPSTDIYMVYIQGQGNVYFTREGQRVTGETQRINRKKTDVIYLVNGGEVAADNIRITPEFIKYDIKNKDNKGQLGFIGRQSITEEQIEKDSVFMICYRSGMNDIITPVDTPITPVEEEVQPEDTEPQYTVVFYSTVSGDTLERVASNFGVTVEQLKEWNDLPQQRSQARLRVGLQLMIYQLSDKQK